MKYIMCLLLMVSIVKSEANNCKISILDDAIKIIGDNPDSILVTSRDSIYIKKCLNILKRIKPYNSNPWDKYTNNLADLLFHRLDLSSFNSSTRSMYNKKGGFYLSYLYPNFNNDDKKNLLIVDESNKWTYKIKPIAIGDFDNDNISELIVVFLDKSNIGSYFILEFLILSFKGNNIIVKEAEIIHKKKYGK